MKFDEIRKEHCEDRELHFSHPHISGTFIFSIMGELSFINHDGHKTYPPLWLSDFDRDDWFLCPIAKIKS